MRKKIFETKQNVKARASEMNAKGRINNSIFSIQGTRHQST
jgi:hypothetical protein